MSFEQALQKASAEYVKRKESGLAPADVAALFSDYFHVLDANEYNGTHTVTLPGPGLWKRRYDSEDSIYWVHDGSDADFAALVEKYRQLWPEASGKDGVVRLTFGEGDSLNLYDRTSHVKVAFATYLTIPKNKLDLFGHPGLVPPPGRLTEKVTDLVWVYDQNGLRTQEELTNWSKHGRIRHIWTEGFARFCRFPKGGENPDDVAELVMCIPHDENVVHSITPRIPTDQEGKDRFGSILKYRGAPLGDGSLDAFLEHMEYDAQMNRVVK